MKLLKKHSFIPALLLTLAAMPALAYAQEFTALTNLPGLSTTLNSSTLPSFLNQLYKLCIGAAAVIAVLQIMRAGTKYFFYTGSVSQNQEAKGLIMNSILGLLLVLSPAIVFGIINPDILNLELDFEGLEPSIVNTTDSQGRDNRCELYTSATVTTSVAGCSAIGADYKQISNTCCSGYRVGGTCCARPKNTDTEQAGTQYRWKIRITSSTSGSSPGTTFGSVPEGRVRESGNFDDQQSCRTDYDATVGSIRLTDNQSMITNLCDCSRPRSEFRECRN